MKYFSILICVCLVWACNESTPKTNTEDPVLKEIKTLTTKEDHWKYLEQLFHDDQRLRQGQGSQIMLAHGKDSPEYAAFNEEYAANDLLNLKKSEIYLAEYGYPKVEEVGELAASAIWAVVHHSPDLEARMRNLPALHQAFLDGAIDESAFSMFLNRTYRHKYGERLKLEGQFREEARIDTLLRALGAK